MGRRYTYNSATSSWDSKDSIDWLDMRMEYSSSELRYMGLNSTHKADTSSETWYICKYTYSGDGIARIEGPLTGAWDDRASLAWA